MTKEQKQLYSEITSLELGRSTINAAIHNRTERLVEIKAKFKIGDVVRFRKTILKKRDFQDKAKTKFKISAVFFMRGGDCTDIGYYGKRYPTDKYLLEEKEIELIKK